MAIIRLLESDLINKIAAGEVVERPASVVKELVENSIDAGSTQISVEITDGGTQLIKVSDNGCGIDREFVKTAFLRHATSKIQSQNDLENILTLGFRGEALSSIAGVSRLELTTKTLADETAIRLKLDGGVLIDEAETGGNSGTSFSVRNLFFNQPARLKFLKKTSAESAFVSDLMTRFILSRPGITFKYINNGTLMMQSSGNNDLKTAIFTVYGKDAASKLIALEYSKNDSNITGFIGKPELSRSNRSYEQLFINGRSVKSELFATAAEEAFKSRLMTGKFPFFILNFEMSAADIDVNVHPSKLEVRFKNENLVFELVKEAVEKALNADVLIPVVQLLEGKKFDKNTLDYRRSNYGKQEINTPETSEIKHEDKNTISEALVSYNERVEKSEQKSEPSLIYITPKNLNLDNKILITEKPEQIELQKEVETAANFKPVFSNYKIHAQIFGTYWIVEQANSMYLIDQHAAHERILFEELQNSFKKRTVESQKLIMPIALNLSDIEAEQVKENADLLDSFGFELEHLFGSNFAIRSVPNILKPVSDAGFFLEILDKLCEYPKSVKSVYDFKSDEIATLACKAAVKANDRLSQIEAKKLIERLLCLENPFSCPHGRPTIIEISKTEIEKKFKRIQN